MTNESYHTPTQPDSEPLHPVWANIANGTAIDRKTIVRRKRMACVSGFEEGKKRRAWRVCSEIFPGDDGLSGADALSEALLR